MCSEHGRSEKQSEQAALKKQLSALLDDLDDRVHNKEAMTDTIPSVSSDTWEASIQTCFMCVVIFCSDASDTQDPDFACLYQPPVFTSDLQALLDDQRHEAAANGVVIRPRMLVASGVAATTEESNLLPLADDAPQTASKSPPKACTPTKAMYLQTTHGSSGVLQLHQASRLQTT